VKEDEMGRGCSMIGGGKEECMQLCKAKVGVRKFLKFETETAMFESFSRIFFPHSI
jgi:hypothetical protein